MRLAPTRGKGGATNNLDGAFTYVPTPNANGHDDIWYTITDPAEPAVVLTVWGAGYKAADV